uniref:Tetratricopeptide repeat-containing protein n=1 Tax=Candidatus Kentrum sp. FW TaxID=2126338 RepID=A0A450THX5_9GAMM|nr:MAG: hypothetical protein BECKFW1821C_GA0114237_101063 [Candidatus Kentron sp. FW]
MDLLDFEAGPDSGTLYFDEKLRPETRALLDRAAKDYGLPQAETSLLRANFLEPEHPTVLVALFRYFYYQHRFEEAFLVTERVLRVFAGRLGLPSDWRELTETHASAIHGDYETTVSLTDLRFYLLALKGAGYLKLRLGENESGIAYLKKVAEMDPKDRMGAWALLDVVLPNTAQ